MSCERVVLINKAQTDVKKLVFISYRKYLFFGNTIKERLSSTKLRAVLKLFFKFSIFFNTKYYAGDFESDHDEVLIFFLATGSVMKKFCSEFSFVELQLRF